MFKFNNMYFILASHVFTTISITYITEILLKVVLNTITLILQLISNGTGKI